MSQQSFAAVSVSLAVVWGVFFYPPPAGPAGPDGPAGPATPVAAAPASSTPKAPAARPPALPAPGDAAVVSLRGNPDSVPTQLTPAVPAS